MRQVSYGWFALGEYQHRFVVEEWYVSWDMMYAVSIATLCGLAVSYWPATDLNLPKCPECFHIEIMLELAE